MRQPPLISPMLAAPRVELDARLGALQDLMQRNRIDVVVLTSANSIFHLAGIWVGWSALAPVVIVAAERHLVVTRQLDDGWREALTEQTWADTWSLYADDKDLVEVLLGELRVLLGSSTRVGLEAGSGSVPPRLPGALASVGIVVLDVTEDVSDLRAVKSPVELRHMRSAGIHTVAGMSASIEAIGAGSSDAEAAAAAMTAMVASGSLAMEMGPWVVAGPMNRAVHVPWAHVRPQPGEPVTAMMSGNASGYAAPLERTFFKGHLPENVAEQFASIEDVLRVLMHALKPGLTGAQAHRIAAEVHEGHGFGARFVHRLGYSIGINWPEFELMQLKGDEQRSLRIGMTFHLVPHLMAPEVGLVAASVPVVVTADGCEPLVDFPLVLDPL